MGRTSGSRRDERPLGSSLQSAARAPPRLPLAPATRPDIFELRWRVLSIASKEGDEHGRSWEIPHGHRTGGNYRAGPFDGPGCDGMAGHGERPAVVRRLAGGPEHALQGLRRRWNAM